MKTIKLYGQEASERQIEELVRDLNDAKTIIWPTDTIYSIACSALQPKAIEKICRLKNINPDKTNLSIICCDIAQAAQYAHFDNATFKLLKQITPGPYTVICRASSSLPKAFKGRKSVGVRIPDNDLCREIARRLDHPLLTTSIDTDDPDYAINPELIAEKYENQVDIILEGEDGHLDPSTIIDCTQTPPVITRLAAGPDPF